MASPVMALLAAFFLAASALALGGDAALMGLAGQAATPGGGAILRDRFGRRVGTVEGR